MVSSMEILIYNHMETKHKEYYKSPKTEVLELMEEGVICQSGLNDPTDYIPGDDPFLF